MTADSAPTAVVTGASTGIGRALAHRLAADGYDVALVARNEQALGEVRTQILESGGVASVHVCDLSDRDAVRALAETLQANGNSIKVLANIAGVWHDSERAYYGPAIHETSVEEILGVMDVGITAPMILAHALVPAMIAAGGGQILNLSGTFSDGGNGWMHYFVSKRALEQLTVGLADELSKSGIRVNCVSPADVATEAYIEFFPDDAATALAPDDVIDVIAWLLSPAARNVNGQIIEVRQNDADD